ncbi:Gfo/Idh/MocA family oxidoreductase [Streptomyces sp. NPDC091267]|uniref:Gfo/Idh/MocA family protein n=1 Tax=Streptomyces sp. NPDC091267 TaxID=3155195 RepID=UPI00343AE5D7
MKNIRIAVLGTSHAHLPDHLAVIEQDPAAELVALHHEPGSRSDVLLEGLPFVSTVEQALHRADMAVIASTTAEHARLLAQTAAARVPALVEKPLGTTAAATTALTPLLGAGPTTTAMFLRCAPALRRVREVLTRGELGPVAHVHAAFTHPGFLDGVFSGAAEWMLSEERGGTGGFGDLGIHLVDLLRWLAPGRKLSVRGAALTRRPDCAVDTGGLALLTWGEAPVSLHAGWTSRPGGFLLRVEGEAATVEVGAGGAELTMSADGPGRRERHPPIRAGAALEAFLGGLRGHTLWEAPTAADIEETGRVLDAVHAAAARPA